MKNYENDFSRRKCLSLTQFQSPWTQQHWRIMLNENECNDKAFRCRHWLHNNVHLCCASFLTQFLQLTVARAPESEVPWGVEWVLAFRLIEAAFPRTRKKSLAFLKFQLFFRVKSVQKCGTRLYHGKNMWKAISLRWSGKQRISTIFHEFPQINFSIQRRRHKSPCSWRYRCQRKFFRNEIVLIWFDNFGSWRACFQLFA